jgi:type IV pilus assembly protein PilQ
MPIVLRQWLKIALLLLPLPLTAVELREVEITPLPGERLQIRLGLSDTPPDTGSFTTEQPARIAIDLPQTRLALNQRTLEVGTGAVRNLRFAETPERSRMVINLTRMVTYQLRSQGNDLYLMLNGAESRGSGPEATPLTPANTINAIDFRRGSSGEGRIEVELSSPSILFDLQTVAGKIQIDFLNAILPQNLERRLDVTDFATPVTTIDAWNSDNGTRLTVTPSGDYDHMAWQVGNLYTLDVRPLTQSEAEDRKKNEFGFSGERLSLNFQNIEVRAVLQLIADFTGLNVVTSDTVQGNITLRLKNVPWDQALDIILKTRGLDKRQVGNVMLVAPASEITAREKAELEARQQMIGLAPLRTEFFQVNYAKASELAKLLKGERNSLLSERGHVTIDERTNNLMVMDTQDRLAEVAALVKRLDIPVRQVLIESRIVIANDNFSRDLGVRQGVSSASTSGNNVLFGSSNSANTAAMSAAAQNNTTISLPTGDNRFNVNLPASGTAGSFALAILGSNYLVDLELTAMQTEGKGEVVSNPRVITSNQRKATIEQGVEIPYQETSGSGATSTSFKKAVLSLAVTPQITPDDRVIMDLSVNKDSLGQVINGIPTIDTRAVSTQVLVDNGDTVVLGGIYEQVRAQGQTKVPILGDIPLLGYFFRNSSRTESKAELLIFVTPKIIKDAMSAAIQ